MEKKKLLHILNTIHDTKYTDETVPNKFLIKAYGCYLDGEFVKEAMEYFNMEPHFSLSLDVFDGVINVTCCEEIFRIKEDGSFERIL